MGDIATRGQRQKTRDKGLSVRAHSERRQSHHNVVE